MHCKETSAPEMITAALMREDRISS